MNKQRLVRVFTRRAKKSAECCLIVMLLALLFANLPMAVVRAAAGELDPTFGTGGKVTTNLGGTADGAGAVVVQPDGKILAGGSVDGRDFALLRYKTDGSLDSSFGTGGIALTDFGSGAEAIKALALQPNGKIVAAGSSNAVPFGPDDFALARYNADGTLDLSFGTGGKVTTDWFGNTDFITGIAIQPDGRVVAAGIAVLPSNRVIFALARYDSNGNLDPSFGTGGKVTNDFSGQGGQCDALALQTDGKIILAGSSFGAASVDFTLVRYTSNGSLDPSFGVGGEVRTDLFSNFNSAHALAIQPNGKIIAAGETVNGQTSATDFGLVRYDTSGNLDPAFGVGGKVVTDFSGWSDSIQSLAFEPDGKIVAGGNVFMGDSATALDFGLARYNSDGSLDSTFGNSGKVTTDFFGLRDDLQAIAVQPDGRIVAAGLTQTTPAEFSFDIALARYSNTGFDLCVQDESNGNLLQINTTTGNYQFTNCGGVISGGVGTLTKRGSLITLQHNAADRRVLAQIDTSSKKATASVQLFSQGRIFSITDRNITNNTCACR